jgi:hypothetical protein
MIRASLAGEELGARPLVLAWVVGPALEILAELGVATYLILQATTLGHDHGAVDTTGAA